MDSSSNRNFCPTGDYEQDVKSLHTIYGISEESMPVSWLASNAERGVRRAEKLRQSQIKLGNAGTAACASAARLPALVRRAPKATRGSAT